MNELILQKDGQLISTTELLHGDITKWTPDVALTGHGILKHFMDKIEGRVKQIKAALATLADTNGTKNDKGNYSLKIGGGTVRHEFRTKKVPVEPEIAKWCRQNGYYDTVFQRLPVFQPDQLEALYNSGQIPDELWEQFWTKTVTPAIVIKDDPELSKYISALGE
jgi:hypothetical protein